MHHLLQNKTIKKFLMVPSTYCYNREYCTGMSFFSRFELRKELKIANTNQSPCHFHQFCSLQISTNMKGDIHWTFCPWLLLSCQPVYMFTLVWCYDGILSAWIIPRFQGPESKHWHFRGDVNHEVGCEGMGPSCYDWREPLLVIFTGLRPDQMPKSNKSL